MKFVERTTTRHGRPVIYFRRGKGPRTRLPPDPASTGFREAYFAALSGNPTPWSAPDGITNKQLAERAVKKALGAALARSRKRGCEFSLTLDWALEQIQRQQFRCVLTHIPFYAPHSALKCKVNPFMPSFDRIDTSGGYTPENTRIVIYALNAMLWDWGTGIFEIVANAYRRTKNEQSIPAPPYAAPAPKKSSRRINGLEAKK